MPSTKKAIMKLGFRLVLKRELKRMVSRPVYALMMVLMPLGFLLFFTTLMPQGLPERLSIGVVDHDQSSLSRKIIRQFDATQQTRIVEQYADFTKARLDVQKGHIHGFVERPKDLMKAVTNGLQPNMHFYYDQSYLIPGSLTLKNISYMLSTISGGAELQVRQAKGQRTEDAMAQILPISPEIHPISNPWINYSVYLIQVLLPGLLQLMVLLVTVYTIGIELKKKRSLKWYRSSGQNLFKALIGKLLPYTIGFSIMGIFYNMVLFEWMHFPLNQPIHWMFLNTCLLIVSAQAMAIFLIELFPTLPVALSFTGLYGVLAFSYSGLSFPIDGLPLAMQGLSFLFPLRGYYHIYQSLALNGLPVESILADYAIQLAYLLMPLLLYKRLKKAIIYMNTPT